MVRPVRETVGVKYDGGKARMGIVPPFALESVAQVLTFGAQKYVVDNWKYVPDARARYIDAALRHINEYCKGEWSDSESNLPLLSHAVCCLMFILDRELELESLENKKMQTNRNQAKPLQAAVHNMIAEGIAKEKREADGWTYDAIRGVRLSGPPAWSEADTAQLDTALGVHFGSAPPLRPNALDHQSASDPDSIFYNRITGQFHPRPSIYPPSFNKENK